MCDHQLCLYSYLRIVLQVDNLVQRLVVVVIVVPVARNRGEAQRLKITWLFLGGWKLFRYIIR